VGERLYGAHSQQVLVSLTNRGMMEAQAGRVAEAERDLRRSLDLHRNFFGPRDARLYFVGSALGSAVLQRGDADGAYAIYTEALAIARGGFGADDKRVNSATLNLAQADLARGRLDAAEPVARQVLARAVASGDDRVALMTHRTLAQLAELRGRPAEAARSYRAGHDAAVRHFGADHHQPIDFAIHELRARAQVGEPAAAVSAMESLLARQREKAADPAELVGALQALGETLALAGRHADAVATLREGVAVGEAKVGPDRLVTASADLELGRELSAAGDLAARQEGRRRLASAVARLEKLGRGWMPAVAAARRALATSS
jgi:tetratricopeptide (TPR) repeat protein